MEDLFQAGFKKEQVLDALRILPVVSELHMMTENTRTKWAWSLLAAQCAPSYSCAITCCKNGAMSNGCTICTFLNVRC